MKWTTCALALALIVPLAAPMTASGLRMPARPRVGSIPLDKRELGPNLNRLKAFAHRPWMTGASIAFNRDETRVIVADTDNNAVLVIDPATKVVHHRIAVGRRPERLVVAPNGLVVVTNRGGRSISLVDPVRGVELRTASAGVEPLGVAMTPDGKTILVTASATDQLLAFDARTLAMRFVIDMDTPWPAAVATHPDGRRAFVTHLRGAKVDIVDLERQRVVGTLELPTGDTGLPGRLAGRRILRGKRFPNLAMSATVSPGGNRLFVAHVMVDTGASRSVAAIGRGGYGLSVGGEGPIVATVSTFDLSTGKLMRPAVDFSKPSPGFGLVNQADVQAQIMAQPIAVVHDPVHPRLLMVGMGSDRVLMLDTTSSDPMTMPKGSFATGHAPKGVAVSRDGSRVFIHNSQEYSVSEASLGATLGAARWAAKPSKTFEVAKSPLPADAARGRRLFTFALNTKVGGAKRFACASCHPDGRDDGMIWQIGAGPRQTPILADRIYGTGPFNWLGTEDKLHDNIKQTVRRLGGSGIPDAEARDLATYMTRYMPSVDNPRRMQADEQVALGKKLFHRSDVGCSTCHDSSNRYVDGTRHDVGTTSKIEFDLWKKFGKAKKKPIKPGGPPARRPPPVQQRKIQMNDQIIIGGGMGGVREPIAEAPVHYDTPSLRHVWASAPYLHDGSVKTLRELLTTGNKGDRMGKTSHLSSREIDALVAYLKTL